MMHSQMTEEAVTSLVRETVDGSLLGSVQNTRSGAQCVALHSLAPAAGLLALTGRLPLPPLDTAAGQAAATAPAQVLSGGRRYLPHLLIAAYGRSNCC